MFIKSGFVEDRAMVHFLVRGFASENSLLLFRSAPGFIATTSSFLTRFPSVGFASVTRSSTRDVASS
jgi:hypothetical protein